MYAVFRFKRPLLKNGERNSDPYNSWNSIAIPSSTGNQNIQNQQTLTNDASLPQIVAPKLNTNIRLTKRFHFSFVFVAFYTLCALPLVFVVYFEYFYNLDAISKSNLNLVAGVGLFIYTIISPVIMVIYMPCLKSSTWKLICKFKLICKCFVVHKC